MSSEGWRTSGIVVAQLCGTAKRLAGDQVDDEAAVAELRERSTSVEWLSVAAGTFMAQHRDSPAIYPTATHAADLLLAAGADLELAEAEAARVAERVRSSRPQGH